MQEKITFPDERVVEAFVQKVGGYENILITLELFVDVRDLERRGPSADVHLDALAKGAIPLFFGDRATKHHLYTIRDLSGRAIRTNDFRVLADQRKQRAAA